MIPLLFRVWRDISRFRGIFHEFALPATIDLRLEVLKGVSMVGQDLSHVVWEHEIYTKISSIIFNSLDIEVVLDNLSSYLTTFLPHTGITLSVYDHEKKEITVLAETQQGITERLHAVIKLSTDLTQEIFKNQLLPGPHNLMPIVYHNTHVSETLKTFFSYVWDRPISVILVPLFNDTKLYHALTIYSFEQYPYAEKDVRLCSFIRFPLTMAFSNILQYERALQEKNMDPMHVYEMLEGELKEMLNPALDGIQNQLHLISHMAQAESTVLLLGETGVGKEIFARAIHQLSKQRDKPFVKVNCGAIPENLIDSTLFGHVKGSFTGATSDQKGYFEQAQNGILFLDEVGELSLAAQTRLLRVLQFKEIQRVGSGQVIKLKVRVIAATHRDLHAMVQEGRFREDLWYRLNVLPLLIPPLRERRQDIPMLAQIILKKKCREMGISRIPQLDTRSLQESRHYPWYGNIRELENMLERALILDPNARVLSLRSFLETRTTPLPAERHTLAPVDYLTPVTGISTDIKKVEPLFSAYAATGNTSAPFLSLDGMITKHILDALAYSHGKIQGKGGAAELLGVNESTLRSKMKKLGIDR